MPSSASIAGAVVASVILALVLALLAVFISTRRKRVTSVRGKSAMLDLAADPQTNASSPPRKPGARRFSAFLSIFSFGRKRSRTVSDAKSVANADHHAAHINASYPQMRSMSASGVYSDVDSRPPGQRLPYLHPILPNQQQSIDTFTATRTQTQTQTRTYTYTGTDGDYTEPWLGSDSGGDARSASPAVLRRPSHHARAPSASAHIIRVVQNHDTVQQPASVSLDPLTEKAAFHPAISKPEPAAPIATAPIPISHNKATTLEPGPIRTFGPSSTHLPSSAATFGMPSTTSLKLPTPDPDDRRSIVLPDDAGAPDDDGDALSLSPSHDYEQAVHDPAHQGFPGSVASSYFSLSPSNAIMQPQSLFGNSSVDAPPSSYAPSQARTRRPSDSVSRRQPSFGPAEVARQRKASTVSLAAAAREIDMVPPPVPALPPAVGPQPVRRPSMKSFDVSQASTNTSEVATPGHYTASSRPLPSRPTPLTIPKVKSFSDALSPPEEEGNRASSPAIAGLSRTYTRAEKGKGKANDPTAQEPNIRRLPPLPTRAQTMPLSSDSFAPTSGAPDSIASSPTLTFSDTYRTPSTAITSPPPSSVAPRRLPPIPGQPAPKPAIPPPRAKRSLPAIPTHPTID